MTFWKKQMYEENKGPVIARGWGETRGEMVGYIGILGCETIPYDI